MIQALDQVGNTGYWLSITDATLEAYTIKLFTAVIVAVPQ